MQSGPKLTAISFDISDRRDFDAGLIDHRLLKRIICTQANHHDVVRVHRGIKSCLFAKPVETRNPRARRSRPCQNERKVCQQRLAPSMRTQRRKMLELGRVVLQNFCNLLKFLGHFSSHFTTEPCKLNGSIRTLTPLILVRIQVPQPLIL